MRKIIAILLCISLCLSLSGCNIKKEVPQTNEELNIIVGYMPVKQELIDAYKKKYPDVKVNIKTFDPMTELLPNAEATATDLMAGKGPDVINIDSFLMYYMDIYKAMEGGMFTDLTPYFDEDESFDFSDYNTAVMDAGKFNENRYIIPSYYGINIGITTEETMKKTGFDIDGIKDFNSFMYECTKALGKDESITMFAQKIKFAYWDYVGVNPIDYLEDIATINTEDMKKAAETYKPIYQDELKTTDPENTPTISGFAYDGLSNERILIGEYGWSACFTVALEESMRLYGEGYTPRIVPIKNKNGKICSNISHGFAVNNSSPNKENAVNFIKMAISSDWLSKNYHLENEIPISKTALKNRIERFKNDFTTESGGSLPSGTYLKGLSDEFIEEYLRYPNEVDIAYFRAKDVNQIIMGEMEPYYKDEISYEKAIKNVERKLELYVSE